MTDSPLAVPVALATGVFVDSDHVLDYLDWWMRGYRRYMFVPFHGWEYLVIELAALGMWYHPLFLAAVLGHGSHLVGDQLVNRTHPLAYLVTFRILHRFDLQKLVEESPRNNTKIEVPLWGRVEPWLWRIVRMMRGF